MLARSRHHGVEVAATLDTLWWTFDEGLAWDALKWWEIDQAHWSSEDEQLRVLAVRGERIYLAVDPDSRVAEVVRERIMASIIASVVVEVGSGVHVTFRSTENGVVAQLRWSQESDLADPALVALAHARVGSVAGELGLELHA